MPFFLNARKRLCAAALALGFCAFFAPSPALARATGDVFADADWCCGNRPRVPSDATRGSDLFKTVPLAYHRNADLFDGVRPQRYATRADMLAPRRQAFPVGRLFETDPSNAPFRN